MKLLLAIMVALIAFPVVVRRTVLATVINVSPPAVTVLRRVMGTAWPARSVLEPVRAVLRLARPV